MSSPVAQDPKTLLGALLAHARRRGVRQVEATVDGVVIVDGVGRRLPVTLSGEALSEARRDLPRFLRLEGEDVRSGSYDPHRDQGELGDWTYAMKGECLVLRPAKGSPACVDAVFKSAPEGMDDVRALYGRAGVGIIVRCQGDGRARDMAEALVAELAAFGSEVTFENLVRTRSRWSHDAPVDAHMGIEPFDQRTREGPAPAEVVFQVSLPTSVMEPPPDVTRVTVVLDDGRWWHRNTSQVEESGSALVLVEVSLSPENSTPVMSVTLSPSARKLAEAPLPPPDDAPWAIHRAAREARASRPSKPRTWHQRTEQVARAYVAQEAPRGLV